MKQVRFRIRPHIESGRYHVFECGETAPDDFKRVHVASTEVDAVVWAHYDSYHRMVMLGDVHTLTITVERFDAAETGQEQ